MFSLFNDDCIDVMRRMPNGCVDMLLSDLPYGSTACAWDSHISLEHFWPQVWRVCKENAAVVLTASQPFTTILINSQFKHFKYIWTWNKGKAGNFVKARTQPLRVVEDVCVFYRKQPTYNPQMVSADEKNKRPRDRLDFAPDDNMTGMASRVFKPSEGRDENLRYPKNIISIKSTDAECNNLNRVHPTQKPIALGEYLIRTYSNDGDTVFDCCMGSGSFGVSAIRTGRKFLGVEKDEKYFDIARNRMSIG